MNRMFATVAAVALVAAAVPSVQAATPDPTPPAAPTAVTGDLVARDDVASHVRVMRVSWKAPKGGLSTIKDYRIQFRTPGSHWRRVYDDRNTVQIIWVPIDKGPRPVYRIAAVNKVGRGPWSEISVPSAH